MPAIGYVTKQDNGDYSGKLSMVSIKCPIEITRNQDKEKDNQPDYRMFANGSEIGAGWLRTGEQSGNEYLSLKFGSPEFGGRWLFANLGQAAHQDDPNVYAIIWNPVIDE